jgi:hypothetical protein
MSKAKNDTAYRGILNQPLLRRIGHRLDPKKRPFGFSGSDIQWRERVEKLRSKEAERVGEGLAALSVELGIPLPGEWPSKSKLAPQQKFFCDMVWALARRHVPAFKHMDTPIFDAKGIAQNGQEGAAPAIDTALLHSIEYYRRILNKEAARAGSQLPAKAMAEKILAMITQCNKQDGKTLSSGQSYRGPVPHLNTVTRLLSQLEDAFEAVLESRGSSIQCEYVEHVSKNLDGLKEKPWL